MKKIITATILALICAANAAANGAGEKNNSQIGSYTYHFAAYNPANNKKMKKQYSVKVTYRFGSTMAEIQLDNADKNVVQYTILKEGNVYINPAKKKGGSIAEAAPLFTNPGSSDAVYQLKSPDCLQFAAGDYWKSSSTITLTAGIQTASRISAGDKLTIPWAEYGTTRSYDLLFVHKNFQYQRARFTVSPEFFFNENPLFDSLGDNYTYQQKAAAFLNTFFPAGDNSFRDMVIARLGTGLTAGSGIWAAARQVTGLADYQKHFKTALAAHFPDSLYTETDGSHQFNLPCLKLDRDNFEELYGAGRNIYITAYLNYLYDKSKPVLSCYYHTALSNTNPQLNFNYNYNDYSKMTDGSLVAEMAKRYVTWGVEYTPYSRKLKTDTVTSDPVYEINNAATTGNRVFDRHFDLIKGWIGSSPAPSPVPVTLFPAVEDTAAEKVQVINCDLQTNTLRLIGFMKNSATPMRASRIDVWTSRNLAWDTSIAKTFIAETDDPQGTITGNSSVLNDKIILNGNTGNLVITRKDKTKEIRVGYTFNPPQTVKAICVVRGAAYPAARLGSTDTKELIQIEYKTNDNVIYAPAPDDPGRVVKNADTQVVTLKGTADTKRNFLEYISIPFNDPGKYSKEGQFDIYGNEERQPGYGIYNPYYSRGDSAEKSHVVYSYIILETPILNCTQIVLVDKTAAEKAENQDYFLNISEMMVFPETPLAFGGNPSKDGYMSFIDKEDANNNALRNGRMYIAMPQYDTLKDTNSIIMDSTNTSVKNYTIKMKDYYPIKCIVIRELLINTTTTAQAPSDLYAKKIYTVSSTHGLLGSAFFDDIFSEFKNAVNTINNLNFTTPFITAGRADIGNPLPYAPGGMDTPRMFAYKMYEQWRAREWFKATNNVAANKKDAPKERTTLAFSGLTEVNRYFEYVNEADMFKAAGVNQDFTLNTTTNLYKNAYPANRPAWNADGVLGSRIKPFLPGIVAPNYQGYVADLQSPYQPDKTAGVDSTGLLMGALAMAGKQNILDTFNRKKVLNAMDYYAMSTQNLPSGTAAIPLGLDANGKPEFYAANAHQLMQGVFRLSRADLERCSVIVPDLSLIQLGDLLVNFDQEGEVHLGIVCSFTWENRPNFGENIRNNWQNVVALSVRRGFQAVNIGIWGNNEGIFGGFAENPEDYHIRRLVEKTNPTAPPTRLTNLDPWELLDRVVDRRKWR